MATADRPPNSQFASIILVLFGVVCVAFFAMMAMVSCGEAVRMESHIADHSNQLATGKNGAQQDHRDGVWRRHGCHGPYHIRLHPQLSPVR